MPGRGRRRRPTPRPSTRRCRRRRWVCPDGAALPVGRAASPVRQRARPDGAPPLPLGQQLSDWRCARSTR
eukprot:3867960-Alexandrium_andersonii.AAC.1